MKCPICGKEGDIYMAMRVLIHAMNAAKGDKCALSPHDLLAKWDKYRCACPLEFPSTAALCKSSVHKGG